MITASARSAQQLSWQQLWREAITDPLELLAELNLSHLSDELPTPGSVEFGLRVPRGFVARMKRGDRNDPLLLQVLPLRAELTVTEGFTHDAVGDLNAVTVNGVLHKYQGRSLLIATGACAVHCRYCFRRHFPYTEHIAAANQWREAIAHLRGDPSISEVILSGGDPFSLATAKLTELSTALREIAPIQRLRIHTRLPLVLPERIDDELCAWIDALPWTVIVVLHANHANELDSTVADACARLRAAGATLLNQSVLLRGINDSSAALTALSEALIGCGVVPYYLHQLDRVAGTAHFEVPDQRARALIEEMRAKLPGYLVPQLVREIPDLGYKLPL